VIANKSIDSLPQFWQYLDWPVTNFFIFIIFFVRLMGYIQIDASKKIASLAIFLSRL